MMESDKIPGVLLKLAKVWTTECFLTLFLYESSETVTDVSKPGRFLSLLQTNVSELLQPPEPIEIVLTNPVTVCATTSQSATRQHSTVKTGEHFHCIFFKYSVNKTGSIVKLYNVQKL